MAEVAMNRARGASTMTVFWIVLCGILQLRRMDFIGSAPAQFPEDTR